MSSVLPTSTQIKRTLTVASALWVVGIVAAHATAAQPPVMQPPPPPQNAPTVAVLDFTSAALGNYAADYAPLSKGIPDLLLFELRSNPGVRIVDRERLQQILSEQDLSKSERVDPMSAVRVGKLLGVHHLLSGSYVIEPDGDMMITVTSTNVETSQVESSWQEKGKADDVLKHISNLGKQLSSGLKLPPLPAGQPRQESAPASSKNQMVLLMMLGRAQEHIDNKNTAEAIKVLREAVNLDPKFQPAQVQLAKLVRE